MRDKICRFEIISGKGLFACIDFDGAFHYFAKGDNEILLE